MATHRGQIYGLTPLDANVLVGQYSVLSGASVTNDMVAYSFDAATDGELQGQFVVPENWVAGNTKLRVLWSSQSTSGNFDCECVYRAVDQGEDLDTNTTPASRTDVANLAAPSTAGNLESDTISLTDTDWSVGDLIQIKVRRDADDATNDTLADTAEVVGLFIEYNDA